MVTLALNEIQLTAPFASLDTKQALLCESFPATIIIIRSASTSGYV